MIFWPKTYQHADVKQSFNLWWPKAGFAPKAARAIKKSSVWRHRAYVFCRQRFICSHRARCDLLRRFLTCVEIHVHFVMHTSAYIDSLVIIRYWSLNKIVQSLLYTVHIPIHDNVTWTKLKWKIWKLRYRRVMAMQLIILVIWEEETEEDASGCIRYVTHEYQ